MAAWTTQLVEFWNGLTARRRVVLVSAMVLALGTLGAVGAWGWSDQYVDAFTSRDPAEVQDVAAALDEQGITYLVTGDGMTILVLPVDQGRARIAGAAAGKTIGFESLENIEMGTSPQRERWAYQRALQGELARTIGSLREVEWARVHLVLPERTVFLRDDAHTSASITVRLRPGSSLSAIQIRGITSMVAGAVDGLRASEVVLVDDEGRLISGDQAEDESLATMPTLMGLRTTEERRTRSAIQDALTSVLGSPGHVTVGVTVDLESRSVDRTTRSQDPDSQVLISESIREESSNDTQPGGVPGTASNLPEEPAQTASARSSNQDMMEQRSNYAYTEVSEHAVEKPGKINRVSVGVVVNADRIAALTEAMVARATDQDPKTVQQQLEKRIEETVRVAMGYDEDRGDKLVVTFLPFSMDDRAGEAGGTDYGALIRTWGPGAVGLLALLLFYTTVLRPMVRFATHRGPPAGAQDPGGRRGPGGRGSAIGLEDGEGTGSLTERLRNMVDNFETVEARELNQLVGLEKENTAHVLRRWIRET